jgi:hypothetical protein
VLLLQHPVLVLVFKQRLCLSLTRWLGSLASFSSLSEAAGYSAPPQWVVAFSQVPEISSVAYQPSCCGVGFLLCWFTEAYFFALCPFSGTMSVLHHLDPVVSVFWWFAHCFSILQSCLTLDVAHWIWRWALWITICFLSGRSLSLVCCHTFCLSSLCLLKVHLFAPPLFSGVLTALRLLCCLCFQFLVYCSVLVFVFVFFGGAGFSLPRGLCIFIPGVAGGIPQDAWCSPVGLPNVS